MRGSIARAVLACGGTGGHVYPAIAIARELALRSPAASISFVGRPDSFESVAIAREGFPMEPLSIGRLVGQSVLTRLRTMLQLPVAIARAAGSLGATKPQVVIGTGGFVSGPTLLAAAMRRIPIVVQEQNAVPGFTNSVLAALADRVALAHPRVGCHAPKYVVTGNPVRPAFFDVSDWAPSMPLTVLVLGGSQGARSLNVAALDAADLLGDLAASVRFVVQCGPRWVEETQARAARAPIAVEVLPFLHDMPTRLEDAGLVACRSGASTVAEICAAGRPALLVPFPHAAGDHQTANAKALAQVAAAEWMPDAAFTGAAFAARVRRAVAAPSELAALARAARLQARRDAASAVVDLATECVTLREGSAA